MAKQIINVGSLANDKTGDALRTAFGKTNANFTELYNQTPDLGDFKISGSTLGTNALEGDGWGGYDMYLTPNGEGNAYIIIPNDNSASDGLPLQLVNYAVDGVGVRIQANNNYWTFKPDGTVTLPILTVNLHNGGDQSGQVLQFSDDRQVIITGPTPELNANAQRLIVQGQKATGTGEGGDVYFWAGDSQIAGGDIKIYAGDADSNAEGYGGYVNISGGNGYDQGGNVSITAGYGNVNGGNLTLSAGNGGTLGGQVFLNTGNKSWALANDGSLTFPDGSIQTTAFAGAVNPLYLMANVDGNISTSINGTDWSSTADIGISVGTVAIGPNKIVYTRADVNQDANNTGLYSTSRLSTPPTLIEGTNGNPGGDLYWLNVEYFEGATYPWVAVGYQDSGLKLPTLIYSNDGITWDFATINLESAYDASNLEFTDVAYGNGYYVITARGDTTSGGMWFTQDLTQTMAVSTNQVSGLDANFKFVEYFSDEGGFHKWNAIATNNQWWATSLADPSTIGEDGWDNLFETNGLSGMVEQETGLANVTIEEFASGQINGFSYWMASTGDGHIVWWPNAPAGPFVSIPSPYTGTVTGITDSATAAITFTGQGFDEIGEKFVISGSSVTAYNGTYYIGADGAMFTDIEMTTPFDSSALEFEFTGTATLTWSHGTYIDSLGFANNAFYAGNDDEEIFKGQFGEGLSWTKVDDKNNSLEYWNDFAYYPEFGNNAGNVLTNGVHTLTLENTGTVTLSAGGTVSEGYVTSNPTIQLTPASPTVVSQKLVIKGGGNYSNTENGITVTVNNITQVVDDLINVYVESVAFANETLYWWTYPESANSGVSGTVVIDEFGDGDFTFTLDNDDYEFRVLVSPEDNNYGPGVIGAQSVLINGDEPTFNADHHLHLTTGNLTETSIFLGTDDHNVRTTLDGNIQITTPSEGNNVWTFDNNGSLILPSGGALEPVGMGWTGLTNADSGTPVSLVNRHTDGDDRSFITLNGGSDSGSINLLTVNATGASDVYHNWDFKGDGTLEVPLVPWNYEATTFTGVAVTYGEATLTFTVLPDNTFTNMKVQVGSGGYGADNQQLTVLGTVFPGGTTPVNDIIFNATTFPVPDFPSEVTTSSIVTYVSGTPPQRYDNVFSEESFGIGAGNKHWAFGDDGKTTLPGAIINSTVAKIGATIPTTTGAVTNLEFSPSVSGLADATYGPFTLGTTTFMVIVQSGTPAVLQLQTQPILTVGDTIGTLDSGDLGGTPGTTITVSVYSVAQQTPTAIDLTKSINKLTDGVYTLANGSEGQIMYLVRSPGTSSLDVFVTIASASGENPLHPFSQFNSDGTSTVVANDGICTLIFTDGSWKQTGGLWD